MRWLGSTRRSPTNPMNRRVKMRKRSTKRSRCNTASTTDASQSSGATVLQRPVGAVDFMSANQAPRRAVRGAPFIPDDTSARLRQNYPAAYYGGQVAGLAGAATISPPFSDAAPEHPSRFSHFGVGRRDHRCDCPHRVGVYDSLQRVPKNRRSNKDVDGEPDPNRIPLAPFFPFTAAARSGASPDGRNCAFNCRITTVVRKWRGFVLDLLTGPAGRSYRNKARVFPDLLGDVLVPAFKCLRLKGHDQKASSREVPVVTKLATRATSSAPATRV